MNEEEQAMARMGRAFAALGCKPEYTALQLDQWLTEQADQQSKDKVKTEPKADSEAIGGEEEGKGLKALSALIQVNPPRLPNFSGETNKGDVGFGQWKYEVECLNKDPSQKQSLLLQAIRRSVRGTAADVLLHLGETVSVNTIIDKFNVVFGDVLGSQQIMEKFYSAKQDQKESVATWGCRIEDLLDKAKRSGSVSEDETQKMLQEKLWSGLYNREMKAALRHHHDASMSYHELFRHARVIEAEFDSCSKSGKCNQLTEDKEKGEMTQILSELKKMNDRIAELENKSTRKPSVRRCYRCKSDQHIIKDCPVKGNDNVPTQWDKP